MVVQHPAIARGPTAATNEAAAIRGYDRGGPCRLAAPSSRQSTELDGPMSYKGWITGQPTLQPALCPALANDRRSSRAVVRVTPFATACWLASNTDRLAERFAVHSPFAPVPASRSLVVIAHELGCQVVHLTAARHHTLQFVPSHLTTVSRRIIRALIEHHV